MISENLVVNRIIGWVRDRGGWAWKVHGSAMQEAGQPDIDGVLEGLPLKIEVKLPGEEPSALQLRQLERWRKAGACAFWTDDSTVAIGTVEEALSLRRREAVLARQAEALWSQTSGLRGRIRELLGACWSRPPDGVLAARCTKPDGHDGPCSWTIVQPEIARLQP